MSPSVHIKTVTTAKSGKRYIVRYRRGGAAFPVEHGGSFKTQREARIRRDLIAGELAAGRDPRLAIKQTPERARRTGREWAAAYLASRVDLAEETRSRRGAHLERFTRSFGEADLATITVADIQEVIAANDDLAASTLHRYVGTWRQVFDFAEIEPNPARDRRVKLPREETAEIMPPTGRHVLALLGKVVKPLRRLALVTIEQTGARVGEVATLVWGDVDVAGSQFRLRSSETKSRRARWVQVPEWLMEHLEETCPLEDRMAERRVFPGLTTDNAYNTMARACKDAGIPAYSPHDLRHRRISLWHGQGVPTKQLAERVGHSRASLTLDVYSHVIPDDEIPRASLEALLVGHRWGT